MKTKTFKKYLPYFIITTLLVAFALQFGLSSLLTGFEGTDDQAVNLIQQIDPAYKPWASHLWEPGSDAMETIMFGLQTAIGLTIIVSYFIIRKHKTSTGK